MANCRSVGELEDYWSDGKYSKQCAGTLRAHVPVVEYPSADTVTSLPKTYVDHPGGRRAVMLFGWVFFFDFVRLTTRTMHPHGAHARGARRNRIDHHRGGIELCRYLVRYKLSDYSYNERPKARRQR